MRGRWQQETREIRWLRRAEGEVEMGGGGGVGRRVDLGE